jgi:hypothetical protein
MNQVLPGGVNEMATVKKAKLGSFGAASTKVRTPKSNGDIWAACTSLDSLTSLEESPDKVNGNFSITGNSKLTSLVGGPKEVGGNYSAISCGLISLEGIPSKIGKDLVIGGNPLTSLQGINKLTEMNGYIYLEDNPITSHILGVLFIKGCYRIFTWNNGDFGKAVKIVNTHIYQGRSGLLACTHELIEAGLSDFAQI